MAEGVCKDLMEIRKVGESTAKAYCRYLKQANGNRDFDNLLFLKDHEKVLNNISKYRESTRRAILGGIVSILHMYKTKVAFKKCSPVYFEAMMNLSKKAREDEGKNEMSETQKANWVDYEDIIKKRDDELVNKVSKIIKKRTLNASDWNDYLEYIVLCLYTYMNPRRNADYILCRVVKKLNSDMPNDVNYLDLSTGEFVFNKYKTAKTYAQQREKLPDDLKAILMLYLKQHPIYKDKSKQKEPVPLLCTFDGKPFTASNSITRILNKIFGKRVGSSMIRHAFISSKFGKVMEEMKSVSESMAHSVEEQRAYYKKADIKDDIITHE